MNYEQMQERLIDGLTIIENTEGGSLSVIAHAYMIAVPGADYDSYSDGDVTTMKDMGWAWSNDFGWTFPCLA